MHDYYPHIAALLLSVSYSVNNKWGSFSAAALCGGLDIMIQYLGNSI